MRVPTVVTWLPQAVVMSHLCKYVQDTLPRGSPEIHLSRYW